MSNPCDGCMADGLQDCCDSPCGGCIDGSARQDDGSGQGDE